MTEIKPKCLMTPRQALEIQELAEDRGMDVHDFVGAVLKTMGEPAETVYLSNMLNEQLAWLLEGLPPERSPYIERFEAELCNPFVPYYARTPQIDAKIDDFIEVHAPAAFAGTR